jgi:hypothetical protein
MAMRSDLYRPVAAVADLDPPRRPSGVQLDRIGGEEVFARDDAHRIG